MSVRKEDINGFVEIDGNPITKVGVFDYLGSQISRDLEPDKIYKVYRPAEELNDPECLKSFNLLPLVEDHAMIGPLEKGYSPPEQKSILGTTGDSAVFENGYLKNKLKIYSDKLLKLTKSGKKQLSAGYYCVYDIVSGVFNGQHYDVIQRQLRGNHLAVVELGRTGPDVAVLDRSIMEGERIFALDTMEFVIMDKDVTLASIAEDQKVLREENTALRTELSAIKESLDALTKTLAAKASDESSEEKEDEKKAEDEDTDEETKKEGMDAAAIRKEFHACNTLAAQLSEHVGTFDHSLMSLDEIAQYGVKKLNLSVENPADALPMLKGYLAGHPVDKKGFGLDEKSKPAYNGIQSYLQGGK